MQVITNNRPRDILYWWQLSAKERGEFDYLDTEERQEEASFIRYRGEVYDLGEFLSLSRTAQLDFGGQWDGIHTDTYFSGLLCRFVEEGERVVMGRAYS